MAVAAPKRIAGYESIPTVAEAGGPADFEVRAWVALFAPAGTPPAVVTKIQQDVALALNEPDVKEKFGRRRFRALHRNAAEMRKLMEADSRRYADIVKRAKISVDWVDLSSRAWSRKITPSSPVRSRQPARVIPSEA